MCTFDLSNKDEMVRIFYFDFSSAMYAPVCYNFHSFE